MWPFQRKMIRDLKGYGASCDSTEGFRDITLHYLFIYIDQNESSKLDSIYRDLVDTLLDSNASVDSICAPFINSSFGLFPDLYEGLDLVNLQELCVEKIRSLSLEGVSGVYGISKGIAFDAGTDCRKSYTYMLDSHKQAYNLLLNIEEGCFIEVE